MIDPRKQKLQAALRIVAEKTQATPATVISPEGVVSRPTVLSTGSLELDIALSSGGFQGGRFVEVYGGESVGKTTLMLQSIAHAQMRGGICVFVDAERHLDPNYAQSLGVDLDALKVFQTNIAEDVFEIVEILVMSGSVDLIVIDSAAALVTRAEFQMNIQDHTALAVVVGNSMKRLNPLLANSGTIVQFTNQIRTDIRASEINPNGDSDTTPCGQAMKHFLAARVKLEIAMREGNVDIPGTEITARITKNKLGPQDVECKLYLNRGFEKERALTRYGLFYGVLVKRNGCLMFGEANLGTTQAEARTIFIEQPCLAIEIDAAIRAKAELSADLHQFKQPEAAA